MEAKQREMYNIGEQKRSRGNRNASMKREKLGNPFSKQKKRKRNASNQVGKAEVV
jgi:hypothetical protein